MPLVANAVDLKLDPTTWDLVLEDGDLALSTGIEAIAQGIRQRLQFFAGEWFLDESVGMPYYESVFVKNPDLAVIRAALRREILATPGVESIDSLTLTVDSSARTLAVAFRVTPDISEIMSELSIP